MNNFLAPKTPENFFRIDSLAKLFFSEFAFDKSDGGIIGRVENYDANRVDQIRTNIIKDIKLGEKKRKKEEKKIKVEKVKVNMHIGKTHPTLHFILGYGKVDFYCSPRSP